MVAVGSREAVLYYFQCCVHVCAKMWLTGCKLVGWVYGRLVGQSLSQCSAGYRSDKVSRRRCSLQDTPEETSGLSLVPIF